MPSDKPRSPRNHTLQLSEQDKLRLQPGLCTLRSPVSADRLLDKVINMDMLEAVEDMPDGFADLLILDPPYNLDKSFGDMRFAARGYEEYLAYLESWFPRLLRLLKPTASVYICGDWMCSAAEYLVLNKYLTVRNRIIWQREKGRGARKNWKNCSEDIWFATVSNDYCFNVDAVKMKRRVLAPYRQNGRPKDWEATGSGNFRLTYPSNFWDDISVPYWSMPENTDHPTQKPEKLLAKLILASSNPGDVVLDPFLGSGTTAVTARKLDRHFVGIERNMEYCLWALARLERAEVDRHIQGYADGVFWERNTLNCQPRRKAGK